MEQPLRKPKTSLVGVPAPRSHARRFAAGRGRYADDLRFPRLLHAAFLRSPHAHARIVRLDFHSLKEVEGVAAVFDGAALAAVCKPWQTRLATWPGHRSPPQPPLAMGRALWQGQPVAIVLATSRALAEDALERIEVEWQPLEVVPHRAAALASDATVLHAELGSNLAFEHQLEAGGAQAAFDAADRVITRELHFSRHTGVPLEPRSIIADFDPAQRQLTVYQATQVPHQMRAVLADCLDLPEHDVRVITPDVGGGFGVKLHVYDDEMAVCAASVLTGRTVKYVCDRLEAFASDIHARAHSASVSLALDDSGRITALSVDDVVEAGAYSAYPRSSILEGLHVLMVTGAAYAVSAYRGRLRVAFQNKPATGSYRGVGNPVACAAMESTIDACARALGMDAAQFRRLNFRREGATPTGVPGGGLSHEVCLDRLLTLMEYDELRRKQRPGVGIGLATFTEQCAPGPALYGAAGVKISAQEGCTLRLEPSGSLTCVVSNADQGQGVETALAQLIAEEFDVPLAAVRIVGGDTAVTAVGGGTFASRGLTIAGEAVLRAARQLAARVEALREATGLRSLGEIAAAMNYRQHSLPPGLEADPAVTAHFTMREAFMIANGIQASLVQVDVETGMVKLLRHWIVEDCGRVINPLLADEQLRGGIVQGLGAALFEECLYDGNAQLLNGSMADYLVPMASEMPDIVIAHVETPVTGTQLGVKGLGEAGTIGAAAAALNAVNDALAPFGAEVLELPFTPQRILRALGKVS